MADELYSYWRPTRQIPYVSKSRERILRELKEGKSSHKTFGLPRHYKTETASFPPIEIKKMEKKGKSNNRSCHQHLPPVPKYWERPIQYPPSKKNYIQINAKQVDQMSNPKPHTHVVDGKDGHLLSLDHSGLIPEYVSKPNYGKTPAYLKNKAKMNKEAEDEDVRPREAGALKSKEHSYNALRLSSVNPYYPNNTLLDLQQRWLELERRIGVVSFTRSDRRQELEDELRAIEHKLQSLTTNGAL